MTPTDSACRFCGATGVELTEEHFFPQWMSALFRERFSDDFIVQNDDSGRTWRARKLRDTMPDVCRACNSERLSVLENRLKPTLTELCLGTAKRITPSEARDLRAWITRFAIATEFSRWNEDSDHLFFDAADRRRFIDLLEPPEDSWFWLAPMDARLRTGACSACVKSKSFGIYDENSLVVTGVAGRLAFQFVCTRSEPPSHKIPVAMYAESIRWGDLGVMLRGNHESDLEWPGPHYLTLEGFQTFVTRFSGKGTIPGLTRLPGSGSV